MAIFWHLARLSFQKQLTYRTANLAGLATNLFFGLLRASVMIALYAGRGQVMGIDLRGAVTFTGLSQALIAYLSLFAWYDLMDTVQRGDIGSDLLKPVDYFTFWLAQDVGRGAAHMLLRGFPLMLGYALFYRIYLPASMGQWLAVVTSLVLALMVSFAFRFLVNLTAFWVPNAVGIGRFFFGLSQVLSGFIMPLRFFPGWFQHIAAFTPFPVTINTVVEIYLGVLTGPQVLAGLVVQLMWFIGLAALAQVVLRAGIRTLVVQGG